MGRPGWDDIFQVFKTFDELPTGLGCLGVGVIDLGPSEELRLLLPSVRVS
jgi:hypothetical protein